MALLPPGFLPDRSRRLLRPRRLRQPIAQRRLAAIRAVQPEPALELRQPRLQRRILGLKGRDQREQVFQRRRTRQFASHLMLKSEPASAVENFFRRSPLPPRPGRLPPVTICPSSRAAPAGERQRIGNFQTLAPARGLVSEEKTSASASCCRTPRADASALPSLSLLARIALSCRRWRCDARPRPSPRETGLQNIGQACASGCSAQGSGQRRMTRRRPAYKAEFRLLTPAQAHQEEKGRLHSAPPTQEQYDDQASDSSHSM